MAGDSTPAAVRLQLHVKRLKNVQMNMELEIGDWNETILFRFQTVSSKADPLHPIPNDGVDEFINAFQKAENWHLVPALADKNGALRVLVDPKYLPRPRAPQAPVVPEATVPSKLDELYAPHFRRLERDLEARNSRLPASVTEGKVATLSLVTVTAEAPQHLPPQAPIPETVAADAQVVGIIAGVLPPRIKDEDKAHYQPQEEDAIESSPPGMLELISDVARLPQFATASMTVPTGDLESNLEERMPADHLEAGDSSADLPSEINMQDDVENLEVEEPHG